MECFNYNIYTFGSFSIEELDKIYNKSKTNNDINTININFFADDMPVCLSESAYDILSTISKNVDEIVFGDFQSNPQSASSAPSSPSNPRSRSRSRTSSPLSCKKSDKLLFTKRDITEWINYEVINRYNEIYEYKKRYNKATTERTLSLIKEQQELYEIEKRLIDIYLSTYSMIYHPS